MSLQNSDKPRLGRGLGELLSGTQPSTVAKNGGEGNPSRPAEARLDPKISAGLATLLNGDRQQEEAERLAAPVPLSVLRCSLVGADLLLMLLAAMLVLKSGGEAGAAIFSVSALALLVGAWCSSLAVILR
jgi:hypothetical protein